MANPRGIDVSDYQGSINWTKVKNDGIDFVFIKATEGVSILDSRLSAYRKDARAAGLICGYYHFFHPRSSMQGQIDNFCSAIEQLYPGDLPPVLDLEVPEQWQSFNVAERIQLVKLWVEGVRAKLGVDPIIYCSAYFPDDILGNDPYLAKYPLWVAHYRQGGPRVPQPWGIWTFWQSSDAGRVSGIAGDVDLDQFNGSLQQLKKFQKPGRLQAALTAVSNAAKSLFPGNS